MIAFIQRIRKRLTDIHPAFALEVVFVVALYAMLLWCVATSEASSMQLRLDMQVSHEVKS